MRAGSRYLHLCDVGFSYFEPFMFFGMPVIIGMVMICLRRLWLGLLFCAMLILASDWLCQPYLDWVHG